MKKTYPRARGGDPIGESVSFDDIILSPRTRG